jgi:group I intron endonuclease
MNKAISGIYKISVGSDLFYIGSSRNMVRRKGEHRYKLKNNIHSSSRLQEIVNKRGMEIFSFEIIEEVSLENLLIREQFYIDSLNPPLNACPNAKDSTGFKHSKISKEKISKSMIGNQWCKGRKLSSQSRLKISERKSVPIIQYDLNKKFIEKYKSIKEASMKTGIKKAVIRDFSKGIRKSGNGFIWERNGMELGHIRDEGGSNE